MNGDVALAAAANKARRAEAMNVTQSMADEGNKRLGFMS
jgi:hypothetical protein